MATRPILTKPVTSAFRAPAVASKPVVRPPVRPAPKVTVAPKTVAKPVVSKPAVTSKVIAPQITARPAVKPTTSITKPVVTKPTVATKPVVATKPTTVKPATSVLKPAVTKPTVTKPVVTKPSVTKPTITKPVVTKPVVTKPTVTKPVVTKPVVTKPTVTKPTVTPFTSRVVAPKTGTSNTARNTVLGALTGVAANTLINKLTGKPTTKPGTAPATVPGTTVKPGVTKPVTSVVRPATGTTPPKVTLPKVATGAVTRPTVTKPTTNLPTKGATTGAVTGATTAATTGSNLPTGVRQNEDGTFTQTFDDGSTMTYDASGNVIASTEALDQDTLVAGGGEDTLVAGEGEDTTTGGEGEDTTLGGGGFDTTAGYYQDDYGNIYDESGALVYDASTDTYASDFGTDQTDYAGGYYTDEYGNTYDANGFLVASASDEDTTLTDTGEDYTDDTGEDLYASTDEEPPEVKNGGLMSLLYKKGGGVRKMAAGGWVDLGDGTAAYDYGNGVYDVYDSESGNFLYSTGEETQDWQGQGNSENTSGIIANDDGTFTYNNGDGTYLTVDADGNELYVSTPDGYMTPQEYYGLTQGTGQTAQAPAGGVRSTVSGGGFGGGINQGRTQMEDGSFMEDNNDGTMSFFDSQGNFLYTTDYEGTITAAGNSQTGTTVLYNPDGTTTVVDQDGNIVYTGDESQMPTVYTEGRQDTTQQPNVQDAGVLNAIQQAIGGGGVAAGALGALLGNLMSGSSESGGGVNQGVDMGQLADLQARTYGSGISVGGGRDTGGVYVPYEQYAYWNPEAQSQLYSDLGVSGFGPDFSQAPDQYFQDEEGNYYDADGNPVNMEQGEAGGEGENFAAGGSTHFTYGTPVDPATNLGLKRGGLSQAHTVHSHHTNPMVQGRIDFRQGSAVNGAGDGQSDDIPAMLADGEYVIDADTVAQLGNGSNKAGAKILDKFREEIRSHKRSAPVNKIPPKSKSALAYLKEAMNG